VPAVAWASIIISSSVAAESGGNVRQFIFFVAVVFIGLFAALFVRQTQDPDHDSRPTLRVYAAASFIKQWGPGPWLKEKFEGMCECKVEYHDAADTVSLLQRVKSQPKNKSADVVLGFDQFDLELAQMGLEWRNIKVDPQQFEDAVKPLLSRTSFIPYDWGILSFLARKSEVHVFPTNLDDLLSPDYVGGISLEDPRTSTPGLQFVLWLIEVKGEERAFQYLQKLAPQVKTWAANWSLAYGLFQKDQVKLTFSYVTSPIASQKEDPQSDITAIPFSEGHPVQYEFLGIPSTCQNCDLAEKFVSLVLSREGQRVIMDKNYMYPSLKSVSKGTLFESMPSFKLIDMTVIPNQAERERILKKWSQLRRSE
jgi:thiamine transport system substrate-binding protein